MGSCGHDGNDALKTHTSRAPAVASHNHDVRLGTRMMGARTRLAKLSVTALSIVPGRAAAAPAHCNKLGAVVLRPVPCNLCHALLRSPA
jgi:hypothetical protein